MSKKIKMLRTVEMADGRKLDGDVAYKLSDSEADVLIKDGSAEFQFVVDDGPVETAPVMDTDAPPRYSVEEKATVKESVETSPVKDGSSSTSKRRSKQPKR